MGALRQRRQGLPARSLPAAGGRGLGGDHHAVGVPAALRGAGAAGRGVSRPPGSSPTSPPGSARKRRRWPGTTCGGCATTCGGRSDRARWKTRLWPPPTSPCCSPRARIGSGGTARTRSPATTATSTARSGSCWARSTTASAGTAHRSCRYRSSRRRRCRWCASRRSR